MASALLTIASLIDESDMVLLYLLSDEAFLFFNPENFAVIILTGLGRMAGFRPLQLSALSV
jgi:hypothetical protein